LIDLGLYSSLAREAHDRMNPIEEFGTGFEEVGVRLGDEMVRVWRMGAECSSGWCRYFFYLERSVFEVYYHVGRDD
jgi:hypothetical protein